MQRYDRSAYKPFEEAASRYLKEFDGKDKRRQAYALESLIPYIGDTPLIDVNDGALEQFKEDRLLGRPPFVHEKGEKKGKPKPAMSATVNKELTVVTTILNRCCRDWDWIPRVPRIRHVKGAKRVAYPITWEEQDRLFMALPDGWAMGAALFAVNTGVRKAELFGLRWSDMVPIPELETFVFILYDGETKNEHGRAVICNSIARRAVDYQRDNGSEFVFPSESPPNKGGKVVQSGKVWSRAWVKAGLPADPLVRKGIHNLRHTFAHRLRACGVPDEDRNLLLGHANASLSQHYALGALERLSAHAELVTERRSSVILRGFRSVA